MVWRYRCWSIGCLTASVANLLTAGDLFKRRQYRTLSLASTAYLYFYIFYCLYQ